MSELAAIIEELRDIHGGNAWHGPSLHESLEGLTPDQAAARPISEAHSIWEIVSHIAGWENIFRRRLEGDGNAREPEVGDFPAVAEISDQAWRGALANLETEHDRLLQVVSHLTIEKLDTNVAQRDYTVRYLLHAIIRHHVYHAGQVALLRKAFTGS